MKKLACIIFALSIVFALVVITNAQEPDTICDYGTIAKETDTNSDYEAMRLKHAMILLDRLSELENSELGDTLSSEDGNQNVESISFTREQQEQYERERLNYVRKLMQNLEEGNK